MRRKRILGRAVALAATLTLFTTTAAQADGFVDATSISLNVSPGTNVPNGTVVTFSGRLQADHAFCRNDSVVSLRRFGARGTPSIRVDSTTTQQGGGYSFDVEIDHQGKYRVWFRGKVGGVHPDIKTCEKSRSRVIKITLT